MSFHTADASEVIFKLQIQLIVWTESFFYFLMKVVTGWKELIICCCSVVCSCRDINWKCKHYSTEVLIPLDLCSSSHMWSPVVRVYWLLQALLTSWPVSASVDSITLLPPHRPLLTCVCCRSGPYHFKSLWSTLIPSIKRKTIELKQKITLFCQHGQ